MMWIIWGSESQKQMVQKVVHQQLNALIQRISEIESEKGQGSAPKLFVQQAPLTSEIFNDLLKKSQDNHFVLISFTTKEHYVKFSTHFAKLYSLSEWAEVKPLFDNLFLTEHQVLEGGLKSIAHYPHFQIEYEDEALNKFYQSTTSTGE